MQPSKRVLIGTITAEMARRSDFYDYFNSLEKPEGTICTFAHGQSPATNRNLIIAQALELGSTHILFLDDDVAFKPDTLVKLMKHDVDIVTGLMLMRSFPHTPIIFDMAESNGACRTRYLQDNDKGLVEIVACGLGCCLISIEVFKEMHKQGLDKGHGFDRRWIQLGELEPDGWCDDIGFFKRVREAGFKMYCDLDVPVGHMAHVIVWPNKKDKWFTTYDSYGNGQVSFPQLKEHPSEKLEKVGV